MIYFIFFNSLIKNIMMKSEDFFDAKNVRISSKTLAATILILHVTQRSLLRQWHRKQISLYTDLL